MLNLPLLSPQPAQTAAAAPKKSADARQENNSFSDTYDDMERASDRHSDDLPPKPETRADMVDDAPVERESQGKATKSDADTDAPESADFAAVEIPEAPDEEAKVATPAIEKSAVVKASEAAALVRMGGKEQGETQVRTNSGVPAPAQPKDATVAINKPAEVQQAAPKAAPVEAVPQAAAPQRAEIAAEALEDLDPMQVTVRNKGAQAANSAVAEAQKILPEAKATNANSSKTSEAEIEVAEETSSSKAEKPAIPTISTTQQMQARAIMEQVQAGSQSVMAKTSELSPSQASDTVLPAAALEESSASPRGFMSAQEAASQARLANSAPNPAYVVRQIAEAAKANDRGLIELTMDPPELGKVRMSLAESGGVMSVSIAAENQATTELMRRHMDLLRKDFMEMGYQDVSFSFEQGGSDTSNQQAQMGNGFGQGGGSQNEAARSDDGQLDPALSAAAQQSSQLSAANGGIDIRL